MFQVGDMVCYPMHGVGKVEAIQEQNILGETNQYYLLRFLMGRMTALVPVLLLFFLSLGSHKSYRSFQILFKTYFSFSIICPPTH